MAKPKMTLAARKERIARRAAAMTDHQRARRSRKSRLFFAKRALEAGKAGDTVEMQRLYTCALRKGTVMKLADALQRIAA